MSFFLRCKCALTTAEGKFFVFLISGFLVFSLLVLAAAFLIDPHEDFGTGLVEPLVLTNRSEKLEMIDALDEQPEILVFGSSRTFTMDPDHIFELTGKRAFNASVSYGRAEDHDAIIRFLTQERDIARHFVSEEDFQSLFYGQQISILNQPISRHRRHG